MVGGPAEKSGRGLGESISSLFKLGRGLQLSIRKDARMASAKRLRFISKLKIGFRCGNFSSTWQVGGQVVLRVGAGGGVANDGSGFVVAGHFYKTILRDGVE